eukprot:3164697-Amphidinium_carterae.1
MALEPTHKRNLRKLNIAQRSRLPVKAHKEVLKRKSRTNKSPVRVQYKQKRYCGIRAITTECSGKHEIGDLR